MNKTEILKILIDKEIIGEGCTEFVARRVDGTEMFELVSLIDEIVNNSSLKNKDD